MWLTNVLFLQLQAKEGFPLVWVICHESVIYVTGHVTHGRPSVLSLQDSQEREA